MSEVPATPSPVSDFLHRWGVSGAAERANSLPAPADTNNTTTVAVKIIDMLGEEVLVTEKV
jgi:hypothetical protein